MGFPGGSVVKNLLAIAGDVRSIAGWGRFPGGGNGNCLQYFFFTVVVCIRSYVLKMLFTLMSCYNSIV